MNGNNHRQIYKPIRTHRESFKGWLLAIAIGCGLAAAVVFGWPT